MSALLDGQLDPAEEERAWAHVHACHQCRDLVEREGWVKTRLAGLAVPGRPVGPPGPPPRLLGSLRDPGTLAAGPPPSRSRTGVALLGGGAVGVAVAGVLALGIAPADVPLRDRTPVTDLSQVTRGPSPAPQQSPPAPVRPGETFVRTGVAGR